MVKCPHCDLVLLTTTKDFQVQISGVPIGILPVTTGKCEKCLQSFAFVTVKIGDASLNIQAAEVYGGKAQ